jgi:AcrR family transcriptional regulator
MDVTPIRRTQAQRSSETQERILVSTVECLNELGYSNTTTKAIEGRAGVTRGAVLYHYPSKADLLVATFEYMGARWQDALISSLALMGDELTPINFVDAMWRQFNDPLTYATLEMQYAARTDPLLRDVLAKNQRRIGERLINAVAGRLGFVKDDPVFLTAMELTWRFMWGAASSASIATDTAGQDYIVAQWGELITPMLKPRPRQRRAHSVAAVASTPQPLV